MGTELFQVGVQADTMNLIVAFRNFANAPNNYRWDSEGAQNLPAYLSVKRQIYFLHIQGESPLYLIWCSQNITIRGRNRNLLGAGRFGVRIPVILKRSSPHMSRPALESTQHPIQSVRWLFTRFEAVGVWRWPLSPHIAHWSLISTAVSLLSVCESHDT